MPVEIDAQTQRCTLITDQQRLEGAACDVEIVTDAQMRMSVAVLGAIRTPITEIEADALTVAGAVDSRRHLKNTAPGSII
ncbi:DUF3203 family protein [Pseudomonas fulva]|uniref:DUF3203 family protein n=1 Tax=Pseudomonas fulva TaxID=47880 RepID=UPI001428A9FB|nr:DUF3203 family protein [Pseudomonas fulva]NIX93293.1 DUF3203 family protein [Pseudomonas fulva]